jgi:predicted SAM-dependent methyltransferase
MKRLNLGAGHTKIEGVETHDIDTSFRCDFNFDLRFAPWPIPDNTYDKVYLFHTIEHIEKPFHKNIYWEVRRILKDDGVFVMSFPEFEIIAGYWLDNHKGQRDFWEHTIYGLQRTKSDYHLCAMDSESTVRDLLKYGFKNIQVRAERAFEYNTVLYATKGEPMASYEKLVYEEVIR